MNKLPVFILLLLINTVSAQHCAPIVESYLSKIRLEHNKDSVLAGFSYFKTGGQPKEKYQVYVFAFFTRNKDRIFQNLPLNLFNDSLCVTLNTSSISHSKTEYFYQRNFHPKEIIEILLKKTPHGGKVVNGRDGHYDDEILLAVFIPFLESTQYANLPDLPIEKHECNYKGSPFLLFQVLPYSMQINFGVFLGNFLGSDYLTINSFSNEFFKEEKKK